MNKSRADHIYHAWINSRQEERRARGENWESSLYKFKDLVEFLRWGPTRLKQAYEGELPVMHQQCSRSAPEPIKNNRLRCCLGKEVLECDILLSLKKKFDEEASGIPPEELFRLMAQTCAWHIFMRQVDGKEGHFGVDSSEGHLMDESDRSFWQRVYQHLAEGPTFRQ